MNALTNTRPAGAQATAEDHRTEALRTLAVEAAGLRALEAALRNGLGEPFARAVDALLAVSGRIILTGMGKSGHIARKIAATLASTGAPAHYVHPAEASHGDLGMIAPGDAVLALSWSGETRELSDLVAYAKRFRIPLLGITSRADSTLARTADVALVLPVAEEACPNGLAPTTSTTMQLVLGDALAMALLRARGFSTADFRAVHPGGKLGSQLRTVADLMHPAAEVPRVAPDAALREAVIEMTSRRFGTTGVVEGDGRLVGIVTDGDLRRALGRDLAATRVVEVMTRNPLTVPPGMTAAEALAIMNESKVTVLFVTEEGRAVGILHIHDLLRAGVA
ncbi:SIS domain-containing protein [Roseomonas sp. CCTCC AB2023176]|uniref:KpsF/GutQ family sugar-phosphate isomerase n=1 Tax=Roseomonas sp. CCTCC AB2023176 TaxID=3342640 RepID=UPI0035E1D1B5